VIKVTVLAFTHFPRITITITKEQEHVHCKPLYTLHLGWRIPSLGCLWSSPLIDPILLSPFTVRHVRRILRSPYRATLVVLAHNHEIVDILPLYSSAGTGQLNDKRLYPSAP